MTTPKNMNLTAPDGIVEIPKLGFGVFQVDDGDVDEAVAAALGAGYRHIDTAASYGNEEGVGRALAAAPYPRSDLFITTKLWNSDQGDLETVRAALTSSLEKLGLDYIDLYLIHWPVPSAELYLESFRAMLALQGEGLVRAVGVSNFDEEHLQRLFDMTGQWPAINQVELHPYFQQSSLRAFHDKHGIVTEAWSPLGQNNGILEDVTLQEVAAEHDCTPAQAVLAWHQQNNVVAIPKSVTPARISENFASLNVELDDRCMKQIGKLDKGEEGRIGPVPAEFDADAPDTDD